MKDIELQEGVVYRAYNSSGGYYLFRKGDTRGWRHVYKNSAKTAESEQTFNPYPDYNYEQANQEDEEWLDEWLIHRNDKEKLILDYQIY